MTEPDFGRYEVVEEVGRGAMGVVYRAQDPLIGRTVAIKAINRTLLASVEGGAAEFLERFQREAQVAGGMSHPNIVKVFDLGDDFIVMEYLEGESLAEAIQGGRLPRARALEIVGSIADALDYAHGHGITHRDIKPANVMIQTDGAVKVMDFGLARIESSDLTAAGAVLGSASYMAPEIIMGRPADPRSDIFSLGVLAYEALSGSRPFPGKTVSVIMMKIIREAPLTAGEIDLPEECDEVFARVLAKEPGDRFRTARQFVDALAAAPIRDHEFVSEPGEEPPDAGAVSVVRVDANEVGPVVSEADPGLATMLAAEQDEPPAADPADATLLMGQPGEAAMDLAEASLLPGPQGEALAADPGDATLLMGDAQSPVAPEDATVLMGPQGKAPAVDPTEATVLMNRQAEAPVADPAEATLLMGEDATVLMEGSGVPPRPGATGAPVARSHRALLLGGLLVVALVTASALTWLLAGSESAAPRTEPSGAGDAVVTTSEASAAAAVARASAGIPAAPSPATPSGSGGGEAAPGASPRGLAVVALTPDVTPPKKIEGLGPSLPRDHHGAELPAAVLLEFVVTAEGEVSELEVSQSAGEILDRACLEAVRSWRYEPAVKTGVEVAVKWQARFTFK